MTRALTALSLAVLTLPHPAAAQGPDVIRSARSGPWSEAATWEGNKVPPAGARVQVRPGHRVLYDTDSASVRGLHVAGTLTFARDRDTKLEVGVLTVQPGDAYAEDGFDCTHAPRDNDGGPQPVLEIGTPDQPLPVKHTAIIRLKYFDGLDAKSAPALVCCGGRMDLHGAPLSKTWVRLGATARKGATSLTLAEPVAGWKAGDRIIVTASKGHSGNFGTRRSSAARPVPVETEVRTIKSVNGAEVVLDAPLTHDHLGEGEYRAAAANLSRNVVVESADPQGNRGHTMYHKNSAGAISYAEFRHLGKEGVLGRYSIHFHLCGATLRGSYVVGASVWDSHNRWITIHGTNYLVVRDCVGYQSIGHGYFLEDGTEVFNVLDRNLGVQAYVGKPLPRQVLAFDRNDGAGFWWANSRNAFVHNLTCENDRYGYRFEATAGSNFKPVLRVAQPDGRLVPVDIRTLPFVRFEGNEASCEGLYGVNLGEGVNRVGPDPRHPFVVRDLKIWETHYAFRPQSPSVHVDGLLIGRSVYGIYHPNYDNHYYRNVRFDATNGEPFNRGHDDDTKQYGLLVVDGLTFDQVRNNSIPLIQISDDNMTGKAESHFRNVQVLKRLDGDKRALVDIGGGYQRLPKTAQGVPIYLHDYFGPGRHAKVASIHAKDVLGDGNTYREEKPLTGKQSRVTEVRDVEFPKVPPPLDELAPATVITHVRQTGPGKVLVRGTTIDDGRVSRVLVNGREARSLRPNFLEWEVELTGQTPGELRLMAHAEDAAGNVEELPHRRSVTLGR